MMIKYGAQQMSVVVKACLILACAGACDIEDAALDTAVSPRDLGDNGVALNSAAVNGWQLNGWQLNGWQLNGWQLNGWQLNGWQLNGVTLTGSAFTGTKLVDGEAVALQGLDFIGAEIALNGPNGTVTLRIDDVHKDPANPGGDVYFHQFSVLDVNSGTWSSLCRDSEGQPAAAILLRNAWNMTTGARIDSPDAVTIACRGAALAKCVEFGYRPWATATSCVGKQCTQISLQDHHQACTRMVRADYCGTGTPHTFEGTPIDLFDRLKPVIQAEGTRNFENWSVEAEWGPNGAVCVGDELRLKMFDDLGINYTYPSCLDSIDDISHCGNFAPSRGAKLVNKYCYKWTDDPEQCAGN
jgi:hypothetical protein